MPCPDGVAEPTRPRTPEEREAYLVGYAAAMNDIADNGFLYAQEWLRTMVSTLERLPADA